jgi:hypothetical protein
MARIDKATQVVRALAGTALTGVLGVVINSGGSAVPSGTAAGSGAVGIVVLPGTTAAGHPVGILVAGEVVEFGGSAGSIYYAGTGGTVSLTSTNATKVGWTVEGDRLVVRM